MKIQVVLDDGSVFDVTAAVGVLYDAVIGSMDWGSGFLCIEDALEIVKIAQMAGYISLPDAEQQIAGYARSVGQCPLHERSFSSRKMERGYPKLVDGVWRVKYDDCGHEGTIQTGNGKPADLIMDPDVSL